MYNILTDVLLLRTTWAWVCAIMNLVVCGTGTVLMSILGDANVSKTHFAVGVIQFSAWVQSVILLGIFGMVKMGGLVYIFWMWSAWWSVLIVKKTFEVSEEQKKLLTSSDRS